MAKYNGPMNDPNWRKMIAARKEPAKKSPSVADGIFKTAHTLAKGLGGPSGVKRTTAGRASGSRGGDAKLPEPKQVGPSYRDKSGTKLYPMQTSDGRRVDVTVPGRPKDEARASKNRAAVQRLKNERDAAANRVVSQKEDSASRTFGQVDKLKREAELNRTIATTKSQAELVRAQDDLKALKGLPPSKNDARVMGKIEAEARAVDAKMSQANRELRNQALMPELKKQKDAEIAKSADAIDKNAAGMDANERVKYAEVLRREASQEARIAAKTKEAGNEMASYDSQKKSEMLSEKANALHPVDAKMNQANAEHAAKMDEAGVNHSSTKDKSIRESFERNRAELRQGLEDNGETAKKREVDEMALSEAAYEHGISEQAAHEAIRREQRKGSAAPAEAAKAQIAERTGTVVEPLSWKDPASGVKQFTPQEVHDALLDAGASPTYAARFKRGMEISRGKEGKHSALEVTDEISPSADVTPDEVRAALHRAAQKKSSSWQDQPRVPAGNSDGGQWTKE